MFFSTPPPFATFYVAFPLLHSFFSFLFFFCSFIYFLLCVTRAKTYTPYGAAWKNTRYSIANQQHCHRRRLRDLIKTAESTSKKRVYELYDQTVYISADMICNSPIESARSILYNYYISYSCAVLAAVCRHT